VAGFIFGAKSPMRQTFRYFQYLLRAGNAHGLHSPFAYELYTQVIDNQGYFYAFEQIEELRDQLLAEQTLVDVVDLGGGGRSGPRPVGQIVRRSAVPPGVGQLLFRLVNHFQPNLILELGSSLAISTLYLALARPEAKVIGFEGSPRLAELANLTCARLAPQATVVPGPLEQTLAPTLAQQPALDLVFFDANHRLAPTLHYFETCLARAHEGSVFIFDDIYWSAEMERAWQTVKAHPQVTLTVDLFRLGLVFFRQKQPKQHFTLRF
jgi:predicted O-methyltransferase YrrM